MILNLISFIRLGLVHPDLLSLAWKVKRNKKTYLQYSKLLSLVQGFRLVSRRSQGPVEVAEFGVGRGGSASILAWLVEHYGGKLFLYDVFGRIPAPTEKDGERAQERYRVILDQESDRYYGNIPNLFEVIRGEIGQICDLERVVFIRGRYEDSLPDLKERRALGLVHIDCDWYESSKAVLNYLEGNIRPGAIIQVDDFSNWEGSNKALVEADWLSPFTKTLVEGALVVDTGSRPAG